MDKLKKNELGFSAVEIILILVTVGMIGFVGWYAWSNKSTKTTITQNQKSPEWSDAKERAASTRVESINKAFSFIVPGGWSLVLYDGKDAISSDGSCVDNSCIGGFVEAPDKPITVQNVNNKEIDFYIARFAIYSEVKFVQKFTNDKAEKSDFGPVDGVIGVKYYQKFGSENKAKNSHEIYEYSFTKSGQNYHVYYDVYGNGEKNQIHTVEQAIRTIQIK